MHTRSSFYVRGAQIVHAELGQYRPSEKFVSRILNVWVSTDLVKKFSLGF